MTTPNEAADAIERLSAENKAMREVMRECHLYVYFIGIKHPQQAKLLSQIDAILATTTPLRGDPNKGEIE